MKNQHHSRNDNTTIQALQFFLYHDHSTYTDVATHKLAVLMWAADRHNLRNFGQTITNSTYRARPHGPIADSTAAVIAEHLNSGLLFNSKPRTDFLSVTNLHSLEKTYAQLHDMDINPELNISHLYPEWAYCNNNAVINLAQFFADPDIYSDPYFQVEPEILESAQYFFTERQTVLDFLPALTDGDSWFIDDGQLRKPKAS